MQMYVLTAAAGMIWIGLSGHAEEPIQIDNKSFQSRTVEVMGSTLA